MSSLTEGQQPCQACCLPQASFVWLVRCGCSIWLAVVGDVAGGAGRGCRDCQKPVAGQYLDKCAIGSHPYQTQPCKERLPIFSPIPISDTKLFTKTYYSMAHNHSSGSHDSPGPNQTLNPHPIMAAQPSVPVHKENPHLQGRHYYRENMDPSPIKLISCQSGTHQPPASAPQPIAAGNTHGKNALKPKSLRRRSGCGLCTWLNQLFSLSGVRPFLSYIMTEGNACN